MRFYNCIDRMNGSGYFYGMHHYGMGIYPGVGVGIVVIAVVLLFLFFHNKKKNNVESEAEEILKKRFVSGEITKEEYLEMKKIIQK